jgi:tetratricopeptide (TPR) repeat protein
LAETAHDRRALAQAHNILGILASSQGEYERACHHLEQSLALAEGLDDLGARVAALNNLALAYRASRAIEHALTLAEAALTLCVSQGDRHREAALHNNLADLLYAAGRSEVAMSHLKQAVSIYAEIGVEAGTVQPVIWKLTEW